MKTMYNTALIKLIKIICASKYVRLAILKQELQQTSHEYLYIVYLSISTVGNRDPLLQ